MHEAVSRHQRVFAPALIALAALAWLSLWAWASSPYAGYLAHGSGVDSGPLAQLCRTLPGGTWLLPAVWTTLAWVLMILAMMLPSTLPLFDAFDRITQQRADRRTLFALLGLGYVGVWAAFGVAAHALHAALLGAMTVLPVLPWQARWIGVGVIALAGAFQFSSLKHHCLDKCRTPRSFVIEHWHGRDARRDALALGAHHGLFCVGCCWALMMLMFVVGTGSLGWMLALAAVMAAEKNLAWGRRLSTPLGVALLAWAGWLAIAPA